MADDTVARNIAFSVSEETLDIDAVGDAALRARIYDFVGEKLPEWWQPDGEKA